MSGKSPMQAHQVLALVQIDDGRYVVRCGCRWGHPPALTPEGALGCWSNHIWQVALAGLLQPTLF